jgi:hypothetical protein
LILDQPADTARFWQALSANLWVADSAQSAPVLIVPLANKHAYLKRYAEPDKAGLGMETEASWPVPYWYIDAGFAALLMLLTAIAVTGPGTANLDLQPALDTHSSSSLLTVTLAARPATSPGWEGSYRLAVRT